MEKLLWSWKTYVPSPIVDLLWEIKKRWSLTYRGWKYADIWDKMKEFDLTRGERKRGKDEERKKSERYIAGEREREREK